jgi:hypothetical protein
MNESYKTITLNDILKEVTSNPTRYPLGGDTPILSGDFEGNYTHKMHEIMYQKVDKKTCICLAYEMHEGRNLL